MQHGEEPVPPSSAAPPLKTTASSSPADVPRGRGGYSPAPPAEPQRGRGGDTLGPGTLVAVEKKSYTEAKDGAGAQRGTRPPDEYGYIVTDQK